MVTSGCLATGWWAGQLYNISESSLAVGLGVLDSVVLFLLVFVLWRSFFVQMLCDFSAVGHDCDFLVYAAQVAH